MLFLCSIDFNLRVSFTSQPKRLEGARIMRGYLNLWFDLQQNQHKNPKAETRHLLTNGRRPDLDFDVVPKKLNHTVLLCLAGATFLSCDCATQQPSVKSTPGPNRMFHFLHPFQST